MIKKGVDPVTHKSLISDKSENLPEIPEKQNVIQTIITSDDDLDNEKVKNNNEKPGLSSAKFLNRVANRFGKRINQSVLSEIIGSGGPLTTTTTSHTATTTSVTVNSESDKSTSSSFTPTSDLLCQMTVNGNATSSPSTFSEASVNDSLMYCDNEDNLGFSNFLNDEDFMMLEESSVDNTEFMKELSRFLEEDVNDDVEVMPVYEHQDNIEDVDNYFA